MHFRQFHKLSFFLKRETIESGQFEKSFTRKKKERRKMIKKNNYTIFTQPSLTWDGFIW
jgi:hypothetical protein